MLLGRGGASKEVLKRPAVLIDRSPADVDFDKAITRPLDSRLQRIETPFARRAKAIDTIQSREAAQRGKTVGAAQGQARAARGTGWRIHRSIDKCLSKTLRPSERDRAVRRRSAWVA